METTTETKAPTPSEKKAYLELPSQVIQLAFFDAVHNIQVPTPFAYQVNAKNVVELTYNHTGIRLLGKFVSREIINAGGQVVLVYHVVLAEPDLAQTVKEIAAAHKAKQVVQAPEQKPLLQTPTEPVELGAKKKKTKKKS